LGEQGLAAQAVAALVECHLMTALGGDDRGFHARWPASNHDNPLLLRRRLDDTQTEFPTGLGPLYARDRGVQLDVADTGLIAGDAGPDVIEPPFTSLLRHLGIGDHRAGHAAHVGLFGGYDPIGDLRLIDPPGNENGF
jgi:hypothetical protein